MASKIGLEINKEKPKIIIIKNNNLIAQEEKVYLEGIAIEEVDYFFKNISEVAVIRKGTMRNEVRTRTGKAALTFNNLEKLWKSKRLST